MHELEFIFGNRRPVTGLSLSLHRSVTQLAGAFTITGKLSLDRLRILPGKTRVIVRFAGTREHLLTGYVDSVVQPGIGEPIEITGRDATADLIDCSVLETLEFIELHPRFVLEEIVRPFALARKDLPLGIQLNWNVNRSIEWFDRFAVEPGESAWSAMERALRLRGILARTNPDGGIDVVDPLDALAAPIELRKGVPPLKDAGIAMLGQNRFSPIIVTGEARSTDDFFGGETVEIEGRATDGAVDRYRPLMVPAEAAVNNTEAQARANWEVAFRAAEALSVTATVNPIFEVAGKPRTWRVGERVTLHVDDYFAQPQELLIAETELSIGTRDSEAHLTLVRPDSFVPQPDFPVFEEIVFPEPEGDQ